MKSGVILSTVVLLGICAVTVGCRSKVVSEQPDDVNELIDKAVAAGADIPPSKRGTVARMLRLGEKDLILGLRAFAELSGGRYPASLDTRSALQQMERDQLGSSMADLSQSRKEQMLQDIFFASVFYEKLQREGRNVQYHGNAVSGEDTTKVLMCWTESKDRHKVLLGDLTIQTLSTQQLAELTK